MLILTRSEIEDLIDIRAAVVAIEQAYRATALGHVTLPPVGHITFPEGADCHIKYGYLQGDDTFVIKIATGFPALAAGGLPTGNGCVLILSARTGAPIALLQDEMLLTDVRTGIGGAIATRLLRKPDATRMLVCGTGVQARWQIKAHRALLPGLDIRVWGRDQIKAQDMADEVGAIPQTDLASAANWADIIVTCTGATTPILQSAWITPGTHITAVGADAPGKQELEVALVRRANLLIADLPSQCLDHGEFAHSGDHISDQVLDLGTCLIQKPARAETDISIAALTGIAAQDIAMANAILTSKG